MRKLFTLFVVLIALSCTKETEENSQILTAKFALEGICLNNVFTIEKGSFDKNVVENWQHPETGIIYKNAFKLSDACKIPNKIKVGDQFKFKILSEITTSDCIVCKAFSPTPSKSLHIEWID